MNAGTATESQTVIVPADYLKTIRKLLLSRDKEDLSIGMGWLRQLVGDRDATANYLILLLNETSEDDGDVIVDADNYARMEFKTYPTFFGKDYRYDVQFDACFDRITIVYDLHDYSRYQVGNGQPKYDFTNAICKVLRKQGVKFYNDLFIKPQA